MFREDSRTGIKLEGETHTCMLPWTRDTRLSRMLIGGFANRKKNKKERKKLRGCISEKRNP